jgi:hypothetical protein
VEYSVGAVVALAWLSVAGSTAPGLTQTPDQRPTYAGRWTYNDSLSDHPRDELAADSADGRRTRRGIGVNAGGRGARGGIGGGGRGGFGGGELGGQMDPGQRAAIRATLDLVTNTPIVVDITQADTAFTFTADGGVALVLPVNGREVKTKLDEDVEVKIKGKWQAARFVVERKVSNGGTVTEEYVKSADGKQLYVIVKVEGLRGRAIQFRRIYDWTLPG